MESLKKMYNSININTDPLEKVYNYVDKKTDINKNFDIGKNEEILKYNIDVKEKSYYIRNLMRFQEYGFWKKG